MSELHGWDLNGTIRPGSLLGEAICHGVKAGFMDASDYKNPLEPTYAEVSHFVTAITQRSRHDFTELTDWLSDEAQAHAYPWALERLDEQKRSGDIVVLSHSPAFLVKAYCRGLGIESASGSYFHTNNHVFSGRAVELDKRRHLSKHLRLRGLERLASAAGDSSSDLPLLERATRSTVVSPEQELARLALARGWEIIWP